MTSTGCRIPARASGTRPLTPLPRRVVGEATLAAIVLLLLVAALCASVLMAYGAMR